MRRDGASRRRLLRASATAATLGVAGCLGVPGSGGGDGETGTTADEGDGRDTPDDGGEPGTPAGDTPVDQVPEPDYGGWFDGVGNYHGATADLRGAETVTVPVGGTDDDAYRFVPAATMISPGTTVRFAWVSDGHTVTVADQPAGADWQGHDSVETAEFVHEHDFETRGIYTYFCRPHEAVGMKGAVVVRSGPTPFAIRLIDAAGRTRALYGPDYVTRVGPVERTRQGNPAVVLTLTDDGASVVRRRLRLAGALSDPGSVSLPIVADGETVTEFRLSPELAEQMKRGEWQGRMWMTFDHAETAERVRAALVGDGN